ncbi:MAG: amidase [Thermoleophilaceae bacterium]|nr:amidase [Thermoleophilaceae bacterium]
MVRDGECSARDLVDATLDAIDRVNGGLNAFVHVAAEEARSEADKVEVGDTRPLAGVPIGVKDLLAPVAGMPMTWGMAAMDGYVPKEDGSVVRRLKNAGAIVVGKTNTPELGILPVTEPDSNGPTRNPWDTGRTPGGSSGGSAAAVASGMVSLAHGNDGGGSIRIPAACNGLVGLKPSRGRVSMQPLWTEGGVGLPSDGTLSRTVLDTAAALDVLAGYEPGDAFIAPPPSAPFADAARREPGRLRIGFATESPNGVPVDPEVQSAVRDAAELLSELGHDVEEAAPEVDPEQYVENFIKVWIGGTGDELHTLAELKGEPLDFDRIEPLTRQMAEISDSMTATDYLVALDYLRRISRTIIRWWEGYDVLLTPTLAKPAIELGELVPPEGQEPVTMLMNSATWVPFTPVWNVTGQPAISLPLHQSNAGLPIDTQFVGAPAAEEMLISLAAQLEQARPWADRRPPVAA